MLTTLLPGFAGTALPVWLRDRLRAGLGGVCLFAQNISSPGQLRSLTDAILAANPYAIIAIDEEGGDVTRLFSATGAPFPGNAVLGRLDDLDTTRDTAAAIGWWLRRAGCTVNFAPCVDVNSRSDNPVIGVRSFSSDAECVARHGRAWVQGLQSTGVAASAKHFPGHGDTAQDSHVSLPVVNRSLDELRRSELQPFVAAIEAGCRLIMTSHILLPQVDPNHPATMSRIVLHDLLRGELGFSGVVVSDALDMAGASGSLGMAGAAVAALQAGCDLLCLGTENTDTQLADIERAVGSAVADGTLGADRVREAT
ncbi:MAG TPA: beta-N-acetylhexosaminidase, partial [Propionibacteriaceae bacterium]|nr:beta-N-acetylhexosaminidase [Propionibacteriaceae bacterium]